MTAKGICIDRIQAVAAAEMAAATARETRKRKAAEIGQDKRKGGKATKDIHKAEDTAQGRSLKPLLLLYLNKR